MAYSTVFAGLTNPTLPELDAVLNSAGLLGTIPCIVSGTNDLTMTPYSTPTVGTPPFVLQTNVLVSGIVATTNTGAMTANVNSTGALNIYKDTSSGPAVLIGGEMFAGNYFILAYDATLNSNTGGWHLMTSASTAAGTVTNVATGTGLTGGPITGTGTLSLATITNQRILANISGGTAVPSANTLTGILDSILGTTAGSLITRGASVWAASVETAWTPSLAFGGGSAGMTFSTQAGDYLAIGNLIVAFYNLVLTAKGSSTGSATISLPVTAGGTNRVGGGLVVNYSNLTSVTTVPWTYVAPSATAANLLVAGSATVSNVADTNFANNTAIAGLMVYFSA